MAYYRSPVPIGSGGFGIVYRVHRDTDGAPFAQKVPKDELLRDDHFLRRFRREIRLQMGLSHQNILPIIDAHLGDSPYFVMPIADRTLEEDIEQGRLDESRIAFIFEGILKGMSYAHRRGVIHRDLKPSNVMLTPDGIPQISDFGLGKDLIRESTGLTQPFRAGGTIPYAAPEQYVSLRDVDERADIYALGKILQAMLTGDLFPDVEPGPTVPVRYRSIIAKCTAIDRASRYQTVESLLADARQDDTQPEPEPVASQPARPTAVSTTAPATGEARTRADWLATWLLRFGLPALILVTILSVLVDSEAKQTSVPPSKRVHVFVQAASFYDAVRIPAIVVGAGLAIALAWYYAMRTAWSAERVWRQAILLSVLGMPVSGAGVLLLPLAVEPIDMHAHGGTVAFAYLCVVPGFPAVAVAVVLMLTYAVNALYASYKVLTI